MTAGCTWQVFFVPDKAMPGWSVVLLKEARGRRITSNGAEQSLGQEESSGDRDVFRDLQQDMREGVDESANIGVESQRRTRGRRRCM